MFPNEQNRNYENLKKIYLTDDLTAYIALNSGEITYQDNEGRSHTDRYNPGSRWYRLLALLLMNHGNFLSASSIAAAVYDREQRIDYEKQVDSLVREIRKKGFFRHVNGKGFKISKLKSEYYYAVYIPKQHWEEKEHTDEDLPIQLTNNRFVSVPKSELIYREEELVWIKRLLASGENAINITGSGGIGKTSLAKILFEEIRETYDCVGWCDYKKNLKESVLRSFVLFPEEKNEENRWHAIVNKLRGNLNKKVLLFVDNVTFNFQLDQDPRTDAYLREITGWANVTVVITSRFVLDGFSGVVLETIGNDNNPEPSVDLFCLYNRYVDRSSHEDVIRKLVKLCQYHTFAIELAAKACRYTSVEELYNRLNKEGFYFPEVSFATAHGEYAIENAEAQIRKLFDLSTRTQQEFYALHAFSMLPEMEILSASEMESWFGIQLNDIRDLLDEAWICYENDGFSIHPLVKEATISRGDSESISRVVSFFADVLNSGSYFHSSDSLMETARKLWIASVVLLYAEDRPNDVTACLASGDLARAIGIREVSLAMYKKALELFEKNSYLRQEDQIGFWKASYYYGYLLSYTRTGLKEAEEYIRKALDLLNEIPKSDTTDLYRAKALDHLGYILADKEDPLSFEAVQDYFQESLRILKELYDKDPQSKYMNLISWVEDDLGYFLSSMGDEDRELAERHLKKGLELRRKIFCDEAAEEIAWSCNTLASHYLFHNQNLLQAEDLFVEAIEIYEILEEKLPGVHAASLASAHNNYAVLLFRMGGEDRLKEAANHLSVAMTMYHEEAPDQYRYEYAQILNNLGCVFDIRKKKKDAEEMLRGALRIYEGYDFPDDSSTIASNLSRIGRYSMVNTENTGDHAYRQRSLFLQCGSRRRILKIDSGN